MRVVAPCVLIVLVCSTAFAGDTLTSRPAASSGPVKSPTAAAKPLRPMGAVVTERVEELLNGIVAGGDIDEANRRARLLFDQVAFYAIEKDAESFADAAYARRFCSQLAAAPAEHRIELAKYLQANPELARALVFLVDSSQERVRDVYALLDRFRLERGEQAARFASLTAAICVVHDRPLTRRINENEAKSADPLEIFDYYVRNEKRMYYGLKPVPAEILVWVVDTTASIEEMNWALGRYAGDAHVGKRFFDIKYDFSHVRMGTPKELTVRGFNLPNIQRYGGVCADQAYFAMSVGKAIGVPTAYAVARGGDVGHAWVGYLESSGKRGWWNFDTGRYEAYRGLRGNILDPQTRKPTADSYVSLLAELIGTKPAQRQGAAGLTEAGQTIAAWKQAAPPEPLAGAVPRPARKPDIATALGLIEAALRQNPGHLPAWFVVEDMAGAGKLTFNQKKQWAENVQILGASKYPDFAFAILVPMIASIENPREQSKLWDRAYAMFQQRADLAAGIRMAQADLWQKQENPQKAGACYIDVIERFPNAGPFVLTALTKAEALIRQTPPKNTVNPRVATLYEQTWARLKKPQGMTGDLVRQSNWYRVGDAYAERLVQADQAQRAAQVRALLGPESAGR